MKIRSKVLVVGDIMIDRYWMGMASRLSPEAPVPVVNVSEKNDRLGGAANVAANVASIGGQVGLLAIIGDDENGRYLEAALEKQNIKNYLLRSLTSPTTVKIRVVAQHQQMLRCDFEAPPSTSDVESVLEEFSRIVKDFDVVIFSDYGKGVLTKVSQMIEICNQNGIPCFVDPKGNDYSKYNGSTAITPNKSELRQIVGPWNSEEELIGKASSLRDKLNLKYLVLTRSEEGVSLFSSEGVQNIKATAKEVFDVSGAGDTVIAVMATLFANDYSFEKATYWANKAAGIVVGKFGTAVIDADELFSQVINE